MGRNVPNGEQEKSGTKVKVNDCLLQTGKKKQDEGFKVRGVGQGRKGKKVNWENHIVPGVPVPKSEKAQCTSYIYSYKWKCWQKGATAKSKKLGGTGGTGK